MLSALDVIYYEWIDDLHENTKEVNEAFMKLNKYEDVLKNALSDEFFYYDNAVMDMISASQKQGFIAGFEFARQLFTGGKVIIKNNFDCSK